MPSLSIVPPGMGEIIGDAPDRRVEILCDHDGLHATWSRFAPGRDGADLHVHRQHTDLFYVLEGEFTLRLGPAGEEVRVPAGNLVKVPPMVVHGFRNGSDAEVRFLNFHAPGMGFAGYMRNLRDGEPAAYDQYDPPDDGGRNPAAATFGEWANDSDVKLNGGRIAPDGRVTAIDLRNTDLYVLDGTLVFTAEGDDHTLAAGTWVSVPPEVAHKLVPAEGHVDYLVVHTPPA